MSYDFRTTRNFRSCVHTKALAISSRIPIGWYQAQIIESEVRDASNGNGTYLLAVFEILEGEYRGRKIFQNVTLQNQNQQAVEIGQRLLTDIYNAVGIPRRPRISASCCSSR